MKLIILVSFLVSISSQAQPIKNAHTIIVKGVGFIQVCNTLLDSGYIIEKKDNELQTARTEVREYPYLWNATYYINVRVKDSVAYISSYFWGPDGFSQSSYLTNKAGKPQVKHLYVIPFLLIKRIAESFNKELDYLNSETK